MAEIGSTGRVAAHAVRKRARCPSLECLGVPGYAAFRFLLGVLGCLIVLGGNLEANGGFGMASSGLCQLTSDAIAEFCFLLSSKNVQIPDHSPYVNAAIGNGKYLGYFIGIKDPIGPDKRAFGRIGEEDCIGPLTVAQT